MSPDVASILRGMTEYQLRKLGSAVAHQELARRRAAKIRPARSCPNCNSLRPSTRPRQ